MPMSTSEYLDCVVIAQLKCEGPEWSFVCDSQDVEPIKAHLGDIAEDFDSFFVRHGAGEYVEVWGVVGVIPYTGKNAYRLL